MSHFAGLRIVGLWPARATVALLEVAGGGPNVFAAGSGTCAALPAFLSAPDIEPRVLFLFAMESFIRVRAISLC